MNNSDKIILIGNSTIVTDRQAGEEIDSFGTVVRFNNFVTKGFEKYVGQKTDIWATRICSTIGRRDPQDFSEIIGVINWCMYTQAIINLTPRFSEPYSNMTIIHEDQVKVYASRFGYDPLKNWLSVGTILINYLLDIGWEKLYLYGFGGGDTTQHYFPAKPRGSNFHNFGLEWKYQEKLIKSGKLEKF